MDDRTTPTERLGPNEAPERLESALRTVAAA
jgi:hypothetical protein